MSPIVFIVLLTFIVLALVYWVLSAGKNDTPADNKTEKNTSRYTANLQQEDFNFETAQELFKYVNPGDNSTNENNEDKVQLNVSPDCITANWTVSEKTWQTCIQNEAIDQKDIMVKLHDTNAGVTASVFSAPGLTGSCQFPAIPGTCYYAEVGVKNSQEFIPLLVSDTVCVKRET